MSLKDVKLPKWYKGKSYSQGDIVINPFSGEEYELNSAELSIYEFLSTSQLVFETMPNRVSEQMIIDYNKGLDWFKKYNTEAYRVLLEESFSYK